jgi:hypothetical protein
MADFVRLKQDDDRGAMLSPALHAAANALCERLRSAGAGSFMATEEQYAALATSFGLPLPQWLSALLQNYSLCGAELFWQAYPPEDDFDGRSYIILADPGNMAAESTELTPGRDILPLGFVCIAADGNGIGDPYFIPLEKEDPPVYQVHHDNTPAEHQIGPHSGRLVAHHLSDFLNMLMPTASTG